MMYTVVIFFNNAWLISNPDAKGNVVRFDNVFDFKTELGWLILTTSADPVSFDIGHIGHFQVYPVHSTKEA